MAIEEFPEADDDVVLSRQWLDLLDRLNIGALTVDLNRRITAINFAAETMMGLAGIDLIGRECTEVFLGVPCLVRCDPIDETCPGAENIKMDPADDSGEQELVVRVSTPLYGLNRKVVGCLTLLHDQSPLADLINRIDYEERSLKIILDNLDLAIFTVNRGGRITFFNHTAEQLTGFSRREVLGRSTQDLFGRKSLDLQPLLQQAMANGAVHSSVRSLMSTRDGERVPVRADCMPLQNEAEQVVGGLATLHDLTVVQQLDEVISKKYSLSNMIGKDPAMQRVFELTRMVSESDVTVLIEGATGTGKDLLAKVIHSHSRRAKRPFVKVNCAAVPENLLESEFFGYVRGAFTGAEKDKPGRFQLADGGTIFLDEIGDLPLTLQAKLLRVLEDREFYPLGSRQTVRVDVRILSATNLGLDRLVAERRFREDLFYRLNVMRIELPPLHERQADIPLLIKHILRRLSAVRAGRVTGISPIALKVLLNYHYPGNVRELENILEHALIVCRDEEVHRKHLPDYVQTAQLRPGPEPWLDSAAVNAKADERARIVRALQRHGGHRGRTARHLGIDRSTLWRRIKRLGLDRQGS
jgi:PAS domain S-box-containing protein